MVEENNNYAWDWSTQGLKEQCQSHFKSLGKGTVAILFFEIVQVNNLGSEVLLYLTL